MAHKTVLNVGSWPREAQRPPGYSLQVLGARGAPLWAFRYYPLPACARIIAALANVPSKQPLSFVN